MGRFCVTALILVAGCHANATGGEVRGGDDDPVIDAPNDQDPDGGGPAADAAPDAYVLGAWSAPVPITFANSGVDEDDGTLTWGGRELVFARKDATEKHLYFSTFNGTTWSTPQKAPFSGASDVRDESPRYSADDLTLYFASTRTPRLGDSDVWKVTRTSVDAAWGAPIHIAALSGTTVDKWVAPCSTHYLMIRVSGNGQSEIYGGAALTNPVAVGELDSGAGETGTFLTQDCLTAYFASTRDNNQNDLWTSHRTAVDVPWQSPTKVTDFSTAGNAEQDPWMSNDGRTFIFASNVSGNNDLYMSTR